MPSAPSELARLHPTPGLQICSQGLAMTTLAKVTEKKRPKSGGSDPTFLAFSRPKSSHGRSRPILLFDTRVSLASARQLRSLPPASQALVKWASPLYFSSCNFTDHSTFRRAQASQNHSNERSRTRNCTGPRPCLRRERPRHWTHRRSRRTRGRSRLTYSNRSLR